MIYSITHGDDPPVVLVAGLGFTRESWHPVIELLRSGSSTFAYDRPGIGEAPGRADPARPVSYGVLAEELAELLEESGVEKPMVLVGHSMGANVVRVFADRHPAWVAGLVFADGSLPRLALPAGDEPPLHDGDRPRASPIDTLAGEVEVRKSTPPPVPAVVLGRTPGWWSSGPIPHPALDALWQMNQRELADEHHAPLIIATDAGHHLPREAPALVAYAIDLVVRAVRTNSDPAPTEAEMAAVGGHFG
ncbi:MAG TPA: alpha/beta hydrolase [Actinoplanes sp.]|jgi:pimeloyl-ACP methyl ester carboxylesterase